MFQIMFCVLMIFLIQVEVFCVVTSCSVADGGSKDLRSVGILP